MIEVYGIKNCNTVKKALDWFAEKNIPYIFHDFKKEGVCMEKLSRWEQYFGWETLLNKKGTTWRNLSEETKQQTNNIPAAIKLMSAQSSIIKRPVVETSDGTPLSLGFNEETYNNIFLK